MTMFLCDASPCAAVRRNAAPRNATHGTVLSAASLRYASHGPASLRYAPYDAPLGKASRRPAPLRTARQQA